MSGPLFVQAYLPAPLSRRSCVWTKKRGPKNRAKLQAIYNAKFEVLYINAALLALRKGLYQPEMAPGLRVALFWLSSTNIVPHPTKLEFAQPHKHTRFGAHLRPKLDIARGRICATKRQTALHQIILRSSASCLTREQLVRRISA
jgi:hypothetical protein